MFLNLLEAQIVSNYFFSADYEDSVVGLDTLAKINVSDIWKPFSLNVKPSKHFECFDGLNPTT